MKKLISIFILSSLVMAVTIDHSRVHKKIKNVILAELSQKYKNVEIQVLKRPQLIFPDEIYNVEIKKPKKLVGMTSVKVLIIGKNKTVKLNYMTNVKVKADVMVVAKSINRKTPISQTFVELREEDITNQILANKQTFASKDEFRNLRTSRFLKKGDILTKANTERMPDILENKEMSMHISKDNLSVTMLVKALEEGFVGDTIRVMNAKYKKVLLAQILSKSEAVLAN